MKYAVVKVKGKQYRVSEGDEILVGKLGEKEKLDFSTLMVVDGEKVTIGTPEVKNSKVKLSVVGNEKGTKIHVFKYKSKSRYRRKIGSRPEYTRVKVDKVS